MEIRKQTQIENTEKILLRAPFYGVTAAQIWWFSLKERGGKKRDIYKIIQEKAVTWTSSKKLFIVIAIS